MINSTKTDIHVTAEGQITLSSRVARMLQLRAGDAINVDIHADEVLLYRAARNTEPGSIRGRLWQSHRRNGTCNSLRCHWRELATLILNGAPVARYRCGDAFNSPDGHTFVPIITRKNYYNGQQQTNT